MVIIKLHYKIRTTGFTDKIAPVVSTTLCMYKKEVVVKLQALLEAFLLSEL
jgi:hypothetical protein